MLNYEFEKIELYFSCKNLPNLDVLSKTDTKIILFEKNNNTWNQIGETEVIKDSLNPDFSKSIVVNFIFEKSQYLKIELRDIDKNDYDFIGEVYFELGQIIGLNKKYISDITKNNAKLKNSLLQIRYEKLEDSFNYKFKFNCAGVKNMRYFSQSKPFLKFYKYFGNENLNNDLNKIDKDKWQLIYESEHHRSLDPSFNLFTLSSSKLCNNNKNKPMKIELWDNHPSNGEHEIIGELYFLLNIIFEENLKINFTKIKSDSIVGVLNFEAVVVEKSYSLIDYIKSGVQILTNIAVDFTQSNGHPSNTDSLHHITPNGFNLYQKALYETSKILLNYDYLKNIPLFGFGLKLPNNPQEMQRIYPMTFDWNNITANNLNGIIDCYNKFVYNIKFSGPTYFSPLINYINKIVSQSHKVNNLQYFVLTILTDGANHDLEETISAIIEASMLPLSIIIIGIGNADFSNMKFLDGDNNKLKNKYGEECLRDIVQFISFNQFQNNEILWAEEVLKEIPKQMNEFYKITNYKPIDNYNK